MSLLSWALNGEYVLEGSTDGSFRIWETHKWTHAAWAPQVLYSTLHASAPLLHPDRCPSLDAVAH